MSKAFFTAEPTTEPVVTPTSVRNEIKAMGRIVGVFEQLDRGAQDRIAGWVYDRYRIAPLDDSGSAGSTLEEANHG